MSEQKEECFIIMPITTPESMIEKYRDGEEHFRHVLECLFIPAIEKAGYNPIPPKAEGSDLIQAEIIKNLETAAIVLCDISCLNPNVFFEFGIRTSLNKPVCIVKDELTEKVPFDTSILNYNEYNSTLETWDIKDEIQKLSDHLTSSFERSKGQNTLWKYFGFKAEAEPYKITEGPDSKLDYLAMQIDQLQKKIDDRNLVSEAKKGLVERNLAMRARNRIIKQRALQTIKKAWPSTCTMLSTDIGNGDNNILEIIYNNEIDEEDYNILMTIAAKEGVRLQLIEKV